MSGFEDLFNAGLEAAAEHLRTKATKMRQIGSHAADMMALIYEDEADEIQALRRDT